MTTKEIENQNKIPLVSYNIWIRDKISGYVSKNGHITHLRIRNPHINLESLEIDDLQLLLSKSPSNFAYLQHLDISKNNLQTIPTWVESFENLKELYLNNNLLELESLSYLSKRVSYIEVLNISNNDITSFPESFGNFQNLKNLFINHNQLASLPSSINKLSVLEYLNISHNKLSSLPETLSFIPFTLQELNISHNRLISLPESLGKFTNLKFMNLTHNKLTSLPDSFKNYKIDDPPLDLAYNPIRSLSNIDKRHLAFFLERFPECIDKNNLPEKIVNFFESFSSDYRNRQWIPENNIPENWEDYYQQKLNNLIEYYKKSPQTLALQYSNNQNSLTEEEKERLAYEGGWKEREILELKVPPNDPILAKITKRLTIEFPNGFKILK